MIPGSARRRSWSIRTSARRVDQRGSDFRSASRRFVGPRWIPTDVTEPKVVFPRRNRPVHPYLVGPFGPVREERTSFDLPVTDRIPAELNGRFLLIGPNPVRSPHPARYQPVDPFDFVNTNVTELNGMTLALVEAGCLPVVGSRSGGGRTCRPTRGDAQGGHRTGDVVVRDRPVFLLPHLQRVRGQRHHRHPRRALPTFLQRDRRVPPVWTTGRNIAVGFGSDHWPGHRDQSE